MPLAYSYVRFSSPKQATGDSLDRQNRARKNWLAAHPEVVLDTSLMLTDEGRSGFKRKDWDTYALARFVECIKSRRVAAGSYLLVENLDRVSRENAGEATELFLSIVNKGIVIVQLSPVAIEFARPVDMHKLMFAVMELSRGHSESAIKSDRGRSSWSRKQKQAASQVITRKLPGWIKCEGGETVGGRRVGGKLVLDQAHARTVRRMFKLAKSGYGATAIAQKLNEEEVPVMGLKEIAKRGQAHLPVSERTRRPVLWSGALVWHILTSRATFGEYVPYRRKSNAGASQESHAFSLLKAEPALRLSAWTSQDREGIATTSSDIKWHTGMAAFHGLPSWMSSHSPMLLLVQELTFGSRRMLRKLSGSWQGSN